MYVKSIQYDRETRDYAMRLDGELVGFARTYHEAEITLDQLVFELMSGQMFRTATELDGGSDSDAMAADAVSGLVDPPIDPLPDDGPPWPGGPEDQGGRA